MLYYAILLYTVPLQLPFYLVNLLPPDYVECGNQGVCDRATGACVCSIGKDPKPLQPTFHVTFFIIMLHFHFYII